MVKQHQNHIINPYIANSNMNRILWACKPGLFYLLKYISFTTRYNKNPFYANGGRDIESHRCSKPKKNTLIKTIV